MYGQEYTDKCNQIAEKWHYAYDNSTMTKSQIDEFIDDCNESRVLLIDVFEALNKYEINT